MLRREPPDGFSPAALGYLRRRGYDMTQLAAALVSMAMKGAIRLERDGRTWQLSKVDASVSLAPEEARVFDELLGNTNQLKLSRSHHGTLRKAIKGIKQTLRRQLEREYFVNNRKWFVAGLGVSLVGLAVLAWRWRFGIQGPAWFLGFWLTGWTAGVATLLVRVAQAFREARRGGGPFVWAGVLFLSLFSLPFLAAEVFVAGMLALMVPTHLVLGALAVGGTNVAFYHLLERPTLRGRGVLDRLEGFTAYLGGDDRRHLPDRHRTAELFERYLPHAIALGLETRWAEGFGDVLAPSGRAEHDRTAMPWYDPGGESPTTSSFATSLGLSLASTLSSSSSPPSASGGGSGGGSSGGGGGGGGGGGW